MAFFRNTAWFLVLFLVLLGLLTGAMAQEEVNNTDNLSTENVTLPPAINETPADINTTPPEPAEEILDFEIINFTPKKAQKGDVIFNIQVENTGNVPAKNLVPIITGKGFSVYNTIPINSLEPGETAYAYAVGQLGEEGNILLTIEIGEKKFYQQIAVERSASDIDKEKLEETERAKKEALRVLSIKFDEMRKNYTDLAEEVYTKKADYDVSEVKLDYLKDYIRNAQSAILAEDAEKANISLILALSEYQDQKANLDEANKKSFLSRIKENIVVISSIAGSIITLFALYELLKRKQERIYNRVKEIKIKRSKSLANTKPKETKKRAKKASRKKAKRNRKK